MGAIHFSIDRNLTEILAKNLHINHFVETGTYLGNTIKILEGLFQTYDTIELSPELYSKAIKTFSENQSVICHHGDSHKKIKEIHEKYYSSPVMYWLDAHWCAGNETAGEESQCPLIEEIKAITPIANKSVVWIDDARYFLSPPPVPLVTKGWPTFQEVLDAINLAHSGTHELVIADDTILLIPKPVGPLVRKYLHEYGSDYLKICHHAKSYIDEKDIKQTIADQNDYIKELEKACEDRLNVINQLERHRLEIEKLNPGIIRQSE